MNELQAIVRHLESPESLPGCVLGTLVAVEGASYRRKGARLLVTADGDRMGSISGGCLEEDVLDHAREVARSGQPKLLLYDTASENDLVWGPGLGCGGVVRVLLEPLPKMPAWALALADNLRSGRPTGLAVTWESEDSLLLGTRLAESGQGGIPKSLQVRGIPASSASIFLEVVEPPPELFIFGAGDDAQPLSRFAADLGWRVTVADPRAAYATAERFPGAVRLEAGPSDQLVARTAPRPAAHAVVMTHSYSHDLVLLRELVPRPLAYLGLLGARSRTERLLAAMAEAGKPISSGMLAGLHAPVGLDIGAETPEEVALSIIAEIKSSQAGRDARPLRERKGPIHG